MSKERGGDRAKGEVSPRGTVGGRSPPGVPPESYWGGGSEGIGQGQCWAAHRKREVVLRLLRGEPLDLLSRELGVELYRLEKWRDDALAGMEEALKARNGNPLKAELDQALKRLGELVPIRKLPLPWWEGVGGGGSNSATVLYL